MFSHRRLASEIRGASANGAASDPIERTDIVNGAEIDHVERRAKGTCEHTDGGSAMCEILQHLTGNRLWKGRDVFRRDAMIGREHCDMHAFDSGSRDSLQRRELDRDRLETS